MKIDWLSPLQVYVFYKPRRGDFLHQSRDKYQTERQSAQGTILESSARKLQHPFLAVPTSCSRGAARIYYAGFEAI